MNERIYIYCGDGHSLFCLFCLFFVFLRKKEERMLKQKHDISDGLFGATGIYRKCLNHIHTKFLASD